MHSKKVWWLSGVFILLSSIKHHFFITGQSHAHSTQYWHCRALQAQIRATFFCFLSFPRHYCFSQGRRPCSDLVHFPVGIKRPKSFLNFSSTTPPAALGRNMSAQGQAPGDKSSGRTIPLSLFLFSSWGTGRGHNCLSGRDFISCKCSFQAPQLRKASLHKTALWAHA